MDLQSVGLYGIDFCPDLLYKAGKEIVPLKKTRKKISTPTNRRKTSRAKTSRASPSKRKPLKG